LDSWPALGGGGSKGLQNNKLVRTQVNLAVGQEDKWIRTEVKYAETHSTD